MKGHLLAASLIAASMMTGTVSAQDSGFYVGTHLGQAKAKNTCDDFSGVPNVSCDDTDMSWKILGGYRVNRNFAAELGYIDFGSVKASGPGGTLTAELHAFDLVGVGILPVTDRFSLYGKIGAYHGTVDASARVSTFSASASEDSTDLTFGFGASFDITRQFGVRAEWQRYNDVGGSDTGKDDIDVLSVGALIRF
jgi:OOP family OmpA-OmpF porin